MSRIHETLSFISSVLKPVAAQERASQLCSQHSMHRSQKAQPGLAFGHRQPLWFASLTWPGGKAALLTSWPLRPFPFFDFSDSAPTWTFSWSALCCFLHPSFYRSPGLNYLAPVGSYGKVSQGCKHRGDVSSGPLSSSSVHSRSLPPPHALQRGHNEGLAWCSQELFHSQSEKNIYAPWAVGSRSLSSHLGISRNDLPLSFPEFIVLPG